MQFLRRNNTLLNFAEFTTHDGPDHRTLVEAQLRKQEEDRRRELSEQTSTLHTPGARIRIWEKLHQVALPREPTHKVLHIIAAHTGLSIEEVRIEQRLRFAAAKSGA